MPRNVEIKAFVSSLSSVRALALEAAGGKMEAHLVQRDVFFNEVQAGNRLKLRFIKGDPEAKLIAYQRTDQEGPKLSDYNITRTTDGEGLEKTLLMALGRKGEVKKDRFLYLVGQTRVHCDSVEGLGDFAELEVVLRDDQTPEDGVVIAEGLMERFGISKDNLISNAYMDMILKKEKNAC